MTQLSAYRILWIQVLFDLPVMEKRERKIATSFRNFLLDMGFTMVQFSVYQRFCASKEVAEKYVRNIEKNIPASGKVHILIFTDAQYKNIITFNGKKNKSSPEKYEQYELF